MHIYACSTVSGQKACFFKIIISLRLTLLLKEILRISSINIPGKKLRHFTASQWNWCDSRSSICHIHASQMDNIREKRIWRLRSFKVIDFCSNRQPVHDLLLVISCDLSVSSAAILNNSPNLVRSVRSRNPFKFCRQHTMQNYSAFNYTLRWNSFDACFNRFLKMHVCWRQTDDRRNITINWQCNCSVRIKPSYNCKYNEYKQWCHITLRHIDSHYNMQISWTTLFPLITVHATLLCSFVSETLLRK